MGYKVFKKAAEVMIKYNADFPPIVSRLEWLQLVKWYPFLPKGDREVMTPFVNAFVKVFKHPYKMPYVQREDWIKFKEFYDEYEAKKNT